MINLLPWRQQRILGIKRRIYCALFVVITAILLLLVIDGFDSFRQLRSQLVVKNSLVQQCGQLSVDYDKAINLKRKRLLLLRYINDIRRIRGEQIVILRVLRHVANYSSAALMPMRILNSGRRMTIVWLVRDQNIFESIQQKFCSQSYLRECGWKMLKQKDGLFYSVVLQL